MPKSLQHWHIYIHYTTDTVSWFILVVKSQHLSSIFRIKITVVKQMYVRTCANWKIQNYAIVPSSSNS